MISNSQLPRHIEDVLTSAQPPEEILKAILSSVGETLHVDRCFLYMRDPDKKKGKIVFCWCRKESIPDITEAEWKNDTQTLPQEDPLFAAALHAKPSIYVEDVETADPSIVNRDFENKIFGHRALIHAHITHEGKLWAILQPAIFGHPRKWTVADHQLIEALLPKMVESVKAYMQTIKM